MKKMGRTPFVPLNKGALPAGDSFTHGVSGLSPVSTIRFVLICIEIITQKMYNSSTRQETLSPSAMMIKWPHQELYRGCL
jgi:hypothetical protein